MIETIHVLNGPNLNMLGVREPEIYGRDTLEGIIEGLRIAFPSIHFVSYQTNVEGEMINYLHKHREEFEGVILNPGAWCHYSVALLDALKVLTCPVVEVHLSNIYKREEFRRHSLTASACQGVISGFGKRSYFLAAHYLLYAYMDGKR